MQYITPECQKQTEREVHPSQRQHHVTPVSSPLHVVTVVNNPNRYYSRYKLYQAFEKMVADAGAILTTVELALRDRHFEVTTPDNPRHIQLRSPEILWHKENLINIGIRNLPADWQYVAWIDADVQFVRPDWAAETVHQLQIYRIVQMWSHSIDLGPDQQPIATCRSLMDSYTKDRAILRPIVTGRTNAQSAVGRGPGLWVGTGRDYYDLSCAVAPGMLHSGYAWAARRASIADLGGLGDIGILGSGDRHMAYALLGEVSRSWNNSVHQAYKNYWLEWQERAETYIQRKVGVVPGTLLHYWHGSKQHRRYQDRWKVLVDNAFDPHKDLKYDPQGVLSLTGKNWTLRDDIINYFAVRNEDSIDL